MNNSVSSNIRSSALAIIGVGNGGGNTVQTIARRWPNGPRMIAVNTDRRALNDLENVECVFIGEKVLKGLGTGGDPRVARQAAEADDVKLHSLFNGIELAIFAVGLGGGTGTGIAPLLIDEAAKAGALTLCFVMLPFEFEGLRRKEQAEQGLQAVRDVADGVICLPNQRLVGLIENKANIQEAFRKADLMLATGIQEIWRILSRSSLINFDFADLRAFLRNSNGNCVFCCSEGSGAGKIEAVLDGIKKNVLFNSCQTLADTDSFVIGIIGSADISISDVDAIVKGILSFGRRDALAMTGVGYEPEWSGKIHVTILALEKGKLTAGRSAAGHEDLKRDIEKSHMKEPAAGKPAMIQTDLFTAVEQERFKEVSPTIVDGNNLDIPTFLRRRIPVQKAKIANV